MKKIYGFIMIILVLLFLVSPSGAIELTQEDRAILAHVVVDPDTWADHASAVIGDWAVTEKIKKSRADYLAKKDVIGYKTRADREITALTEKGKTEDQARAMLGLPAK